MSPDHDRFVVQHSSARAPSLNWCLADPPDQPSMATKTQASGQAPSTQPKWLALTGQGRKVATFQVLVCAGGLLMFISFIDTPLRFPEGFRPYLAATGCALTFGGLFYLLTAVKCPRCNGRVAAYLIAKSSFQSWLSDLEGATSCPSCGHTPEPQEPEARTSADAIG